MLMTRTSSTNNKTIQKKSSSTTRSGTFNKLLPFLIMALTLIVYFGSLKNGFVDNWDDNLYILKNNYNQSLSVSNFISIFSEFYHSNYHPLTSVLFAIQYNLWELNAIPYHLVSLILHFLNIYLVYILFRTVSQNHITAAVVALLFALHPMHVESVAWISAQKDLLYSAFYLLALTFYFKYLDNKLNIKYLIIAFIFFALSCLSKSMAITLSVLLFLADYYKARKLSPLMFLEKIPFLALSVIFGIIALKSQATGGALVDLTPLYSITDRFFIVSYAVLMYLVKFIAPHDFSALYYYPFKNSAGFLPVICYAAPVILAAIALAVIKAGKFRKDAVFGILFFLITIFIVLQIKPFGQAVIAERYTYIPYLGLFFIFARFGENIYKNVYSFSTSLKPFILPALFAFSFFFSIATYNRIKVWKDGETLFTDVINNYPGIFYGYWARGTSRSEKNPADIQGALEDFNTSINLQPAYTQAYYDRGITLYRAGKYEEAVNDLSEVITKMPDNAEAYSNRGAARFALNDFEGALSDCNAAISLKPYYVDPYINRGNVYGMLGNFEASIKDYDTAIKIKPDIGLTYLNRGLSKKNSGDSTGACNDWRIASDKGIRDAAELYLQFCK